MLLSRWQAADPVPADVVYLVEELSMTRCSEPLRQLAGVPSPTGWCCASCATCCAIPGGHRGGAGGGRGAGGREVLRSPDQLWQPLQACYQSLVDCGMRIIADGALLDLLRRVSCLVCTWYATMRARTVPPHRGTVLTTWLGLGDYAGWDEDARRSFLLRELASRRPLVPHDWQPSDAVREVLDTSRGGRSASPGTGRVCHIHGAPGLGRAGGASAAERAVAATTCRWRPV